MKRFAKLCLMAVAIILLCVTAYAADQSRIDAGPLTLEVSTSETAVLFHVVDQISQWSPYCHKQYVRYFEGLDGGLSQEDKDFLAQHAEVRKKHDWGEGLEQTFYTPLKLDAALAKGIKDGRITEEEAQTERAIFAHFQPRIATLISDTAPTIAGFTSDLNMKKGDLTSFADRLSRFTGCSKLVIPVYLLPSPSNGGGGGYNGGIVALEVGKDAIIYDNFVHELFHAFIMTKQSALDATAQSTNGLDAEKLSEGLAYAYSPGMMGDAGFARLVSTASGFIAKGSSLSEPYVASNLYGLALQPLLKQALNDKKQTLETFLLKAADTWLSLQELHKAMKPGSKTSDSRDFRAESKHSIMAFGSDDILNEENVRALAQSSSLNIFGRPHKANFYKDMLTRVSKPGDTVLLLLSLEDTRRVPDEYTDLMPSPWPDVESKLKQGQLVVLKGKAREMNVWLIATPTKAELAKEFGRMVNDPKAFKLPQP